MQRLTGEVGNPRGLDVLQDLGAKIVDFRQHEREPLHDELPRLLVHIRQTGEQGDHLLNEHVAEQQQQHACGDDHHGERQQRRHATLPAVTHQGLHHRFDGERKEQRDKDVVDQVGDRPPGSPAVGKQHYGHGDVQQSPAEPFRRPAFVAFCWEQRSQIPAQPFTATCSILIACMRAFIHGNPL